MMIMTAKMTITEQVNAIAFDTLTKEQFDFLKGRALMSVRKSNGNRPQTKTQKENAQFKEQILTILADEEKGLTATQVGEKFGWHGSQKASALLTQLKKEGAVTKVEDGKVTLFRLA